MISSCRGLGPWGPNIVRKYTSARFGSYATGELLNEEESKLLTGTIHTTCIIQVFITQPLTLFFPVYLDYIYHTLAAKGSGELCLKYIFSFGAFARKPLLHRFVALCDPILTFPFPFVPTHLKFTN